MRGRTVSLPPAGAVAFDPDFHVGEDGSLLSYKDSETLEQSYDYYLDKDIDLDKTLVMAAIAHCAVGPWLCVPPFRTGC